MTTPERLRRRQIRNDIFIAFLAAFLVLSVAYFRLQDKRQTDCFRSFVATQSETGKIRSGLNEQESLATRKVIRGSGSVTSREEFEQLLADYDMSLRRIDKEREENPVPVFDPERC